MTARLTAAVALCLLQGAIAFAQEGQYRSRVLIDAGGSLGDASALSVEQLESQLGSLQGAYAQSSAGRHLARHYLQQGEYGKAEQYYQQALQAEGLSDIANREMLRELAQVYLLQRKFKQAADTLQHTLDSGLAPAAADYLLLARAQQELGNHLAAVDTLDALRRSEAELGVTQLEQMMALYYRAGAYAASATVLQRLLQLNPEKPEYWQQLVAVYLRQNKRRQALDQLSLAHDKGVPLGADNLLLLADLQASQKSPYLAASTLQTAMDEGELESSADNYRKLFEFWLQARERERSATALARAAQLSGDTLLYLHLAQLQMEQEQWQNMQLTVLTACKAQLEDRYVSRANLLLGISELKLGRPEAARIALINATLIGGANTQAAQWLRYMEAAPATKDEVRRIASPCFGSEGVRRKLPATVAAESSTTTAPATTAVDSLSIEEKMPATVAALELKSTGRRRLFIAEETIDKDALNELSNKARGVVARMNVAMIRAGGASDGPPELHLRMAAMPPEDDSINYRLVLPVRGSPSASGRYQLDYDEGFYYVSQRLTGGAAQVLQAAAELAERARAQQHQLTGDMRLVMSTRGDEIELQLGVRPEHEDAAPQ